MLNKTFKNYLVIAALPEEEAAIANVLSSFPSASFCVSEKFDLHCRTFTKPSHRIHLLRCGMGTVNAGISVALFAEHFPVDAILLLGVGGALTANLRIGDVVVSSVVLQHDYYSSLDFGNPRMAPGHILFTEAECESHVAHFMATDSLLDFERSANFSGVVRVGAVLSGNEFVGTSARKSELAKLHPDALLVEMESAGVAQVAEKLKVPFVVVKTVADRLFPDGTIENDFKTCLEAAAANAARVVS